MCIIGTASVVRHGATNYTGIFPDLADEGLPIIKNTAKEIAQRFPKKPVFISSPAERAVATALYVMEEYGLGQKRKDIQIEISLGPIIAFDRQMLLFHFERVAGRIKCPIESHRTFDRFYMESDEFQNGIFCEPRSSSKYRFVEFLKKLPIICKTDCHVVAVTHIELVGVFIHEWFGTEGDYFGPAEAVHLTVFENGELQAEFRGSVKTFKI